MTKVFLYLSALVSCTALFAQSATNMPLATLVHISGTVKQCGKPVSGAWWVRFNGSPPVASKTVKADNRGAYEADLPLGLWTMTLRAGPDDTTEFARSRHFQASTPGNLVFNFYLRPPIACSVRGTPEQRAALCWGEEFHEVPSSVQDATFEVDLFDLSNQFGIPCGIVEGKSHHREFATYNLLTVEADHLSYHSSEKILQACGDVLMQDESGEHKADSVRLRLQDGQVFVLTQ